MDNYNIWKLNDFGEREKCYKEKIEQLENDLDKERNIVYIDNKNSEIINNIKNETKKRKFKKLWNKIINKRSNQNQFHMKSI